MLLPVLLWSTSLSFATHFKIQINSQNTIDIPPQHMFIPSNSIRCCKLIYNFLQSQLVHLFFTDELTRRGALLLSFFIPCDLSLLLPLVSTLVFSRTGDVLPRLNFLTHRFPRFEELVLFRHASCVFSSLRCNGHSLLLHSYLSRIGRIENPSCSACGHPSKDTSHLILHCPPTNSLCHSLFADSLSL